MKYTVQRLDQAKIELIAQDPAFSELDKAFLSGLNVRIVEDPEAQSHIDCQTFAFAPFWGYSAEVVARCQHLQPVMYIGNSTGWSFSKDARVIKAFQLHESGAGSLTDVEQSDNGDDWGLEDLSKINLELDLLPEERQQRLRFLHDFRQRHTSADLVTGACCGEVCDALDGLALYCGNAVPIDATAGDAIECALCSATRQTDHIWFKMAEKTFYEAWCARVMEGRRWQGIATKALAVMSLLKGQRRSCDTD